MTSQPNLVVEVQITTGDLYRSTLRMIFRRLKFLLVLYPILTVFLIYQLSRADYHWSWSFGNLFGPLFFFVFAPYAFFIAPYFASEKYLRQNPIVAGPKTFKFSEEGIDVVGLQSNGHLQWAAILEARETSAQFLLYPQTAAAHIVPKRNLKNIDEQAILRNLIRANVKKAKLRA